MQSVETSLTLETDQLENIEYCTHTHLCLRAHKGGCHVNIQYSTLRVYMSPLTPNPSTFYHCCYCCLRWQGCSAYHRYRIYLYMLNHGHQFIRGTEQPFAQGKCANFTQSGLRNGTCNLTLHRSAKRWTTVLPLVDFQIKNLDFTGVVSDGFPKLAHLLA